MATSIEYSHFQLLDLSYPVKFKITKMIRSFEPQQYSDEYHVFEIEVTFNELLNLFELVTTDGLEFMRQAGWINQDNEHNPLISAGKFRITVTLCRDNELNQNHDSWRLTGRHYFGETMLIGEVDDKSIKTSFTEQEILNVTWDNCCSNSQLIFESDIR